MIRRRVSNLAAGLSCACAAAFPVIAQDNPLARFLEVPGASVTLPVEAAKKPFPKAFVDEARTYFGNFHAQMGGDHALYYGMHLSEFMLSALSAPNPVYRPLERSPRPELADIMIETASEGPLSLAEYFGHPTFRHQAVMMLFEGRVVYETYPGLPETRMHFWASAAKTTVGLVVALLAEEGKIDLDRQITGYVPELSDTAWDRVTVLQVLNHTTGLDAEETIPSLIDPSSVLVRFFSAIFGAANPATGRTEDAVSVLRSIQPIPSESPGAVFRYSSLNTHVLTMMIENIEERNWASVFEQRVWSRMTARMPAMVSLSPDGTALPLGLVSSTLEDMARFGAVFTPSWPAVAREQVVSEDILARIRTGGDPNAFAGSNKDAQGQNLFAGERAISNAYHFDWIFEDGAMFKSGNLQQGIYIDPGRDFVGVYFSTAPYLPPFGETKAPAYLRAAAKLLAGG